MSTIQLVSTDITEINAEAIVCPAHKHLIRGRGLSAHIFERAGNELVIACNALDDCPVGEARITPGFNLKAKYIIHTVTPQWSGGDQWGGSDLHLLRSCYDNVLRLAEEQGVKSLALPVLGAGTNRAPHLLVAKIGAEALKAKSAVFDELIVSVHSAQAMECWQDALGLTAPV